MPHIKKGSSNQHHCPLKSKGNCRFEKQFGLGYCSKHLTHCRTHGIIHIRTEQCWKCKQLEFEAAQKKREREADKKKPDDAGKKKSQKK
ncbi:hypothetical protein F4811DRAFT_551592 [Daldinia bambusicola]|nr:hypothetical protein F4811DRAFT_551592 [Daldinia bambusicola]